MKQTIDCLDPRDIASLLSGELDLVRQAEFEQHLADCPACCCRLQHAVGNNDWWDEIESSLQNVMLDEWRDSGESTSELFGFGAFEDMGPADRELGESRSTASLLKLLGPTDDPAMLGRIGPYEIVGLLGQGGMGAVFKGFDRTLNRFVAIKMLLPHLATSGAARKRFAREGKAIAAVVDDHVMAIHCVDEWQGLPYLVMNYSRGISLQKRLRDSGPMELREILRIGMQAAKGLAAAHAQGIVHRDVKPSNILLDQNVERIQLVDFGLARAVDDASLTCSGTLAGTPQYMSPEQARAEAVDHRSDLFSLGSVLYAMCAGYAPFRADSGYSVLRLIIEKEPRPIREINSDIPDWLYAIISKLMAKQAVDRFDSAKQVADLLEACLAHVQQPTTVPLPPSVARLSLIEIPNSAADPQQCDSSSNAMGGTWRRFVGPPFNKYLAAAAAAAAIFFAFVLLVLELSKGTLTIKSEADNVAIRIVQGKDTVQELTVSKQGATTRLRAGTYTVEIEGDSTVYEIQGDNVTVKRGEQTLVNISISTPNPRVGNVGDGIQWSTTGTDDGLLSGARLILPNVLLTPGQPVAVEYRLKNVSIETKKLTLYVRGNREHITLSKDNRITDAGITTADEPIQITLDPGKEYVATSHRASIDTHGFAPGDYQVALGSAFFYSEQANPTIRQEIPHRGNLSFKILTPDATISRLLREDLHWGKSISGLRLGSKFRGKSTDFAIGSVVEAELWLANETNHGMDCSILLPHPLDGWVIKIENQLGTSIMLERPPRDSLYHPQKVLCDQIGAGRNQENYG